MNPSALVWISPASPLFTTVLGTGITDQAGRSPRALVDPTDWLNLLDDVRTHRLEGLLVHAVAFGDLVVGDDCRRHVAELEVALTQARMWHETQTVAIVTLLLDAGIDTRVLKGPALRVLDYPDPQMRPTGDLDLLVAGDQIDEACRVLSSAGGVRADPDPISGYTARAGKGATMAMETGLEVDLHRLLVWGPFGVRTPTDDLWRASRPFAIAGLRVETLPVEETLLHASYHLLIHGWRRALSLRDVVQLVTAPDLSTDRVLRLARRWGAEPVLAEAVRLSVHVADVCLPDSEIVAWARSYRPGVRQRLWLRTQRPEAPIGSLDAVATYLEMQPAERAVLREATFHPEPGTWPSPGDRLRRVLARVQRTRW